MQDLTAKISEIFTKDFHDPKDFQAAWHTGQIRAELRRHGRPIGPYDQMIAGHARARGLAVVTNNHAEFERVSGLRVVNWRRQESSNG